MANSRSRSRGAEVANRDAPPRHGSPGKEKKYDDGAASRSRRKDSRSPSRKKGRNDSRRRSRSHRRRSPSRRRDNSRRRGSARGRDGKQTGIVTTWRHDKGFGFIRPDHGGNDIFVHVRELRDGNALREGDEVDFEEGYDSRARKPQAERVTGAIRERSYERGRRDRSRGRY
eukprot:GEMP01040318.1.p1 GENE.GEMP01040318.1~~GEMP01040318.1.p1  ORF type:complete len:182 (+),score=46.22 GEMP01040318.1:32-547(+)